MVSWRAFGRYFSTQGRLAVSFCCTILFLHQIRDNEIISFEKKQDVASPLAMSSFREGAVSGRSLKEELTIFFFRELDVPQLGESNLMNPKKSVEVKIFTEAFFWVFPALLITLVRHFCRSNSTLITLGTPIFMFCVTDLCSTEKLLLYLRAPTMLGRYVRYDERW